MTRTLAVLALAVAGAGVLSAESSSAQLAVNVTVVRSCVVDTRPEGSPRLTCTTGAQSTLKVSETPPQPSSSTTSEGSTVLTLHF